MKDVGWVRYYAWRWVNGTAELSLEETAGYRAVCDLIYCDEGPIQDDERRIARVAKLHWRSWRKVRARLLKLGKIQHLAPVKGVPGSDFAGGYLTNKRCEQELKMSREKSTTRARPPHDGRTTGAQRGQFPTRSRS